MSFAKMDKERLKAVTASGGRAAHQRGHAHVFTAETARAAGRKGGMVVSQDREHMAKIGRLGAQATHQPQDEQTSS